MITTPTGNDVIESQELDKELDKERLKSLKYFHYLRDKIIAWEAHNFPNTPDYRNLLGMGEELGELMHAHLKAEQKIRQDKTSTRDKKKDAIGDMLIYAVNYCHTNGICLLDCLETAWNEVSKRDWIKFPKNGISE